MRSTIDRFRKSKAHIFIRKHERFLPVIFFIGGFVFDSMTLGRIDRLYDLVVLCLHMGFLTLMICLFNLVGDDRWKGSLVWKWRAYFPLVIQFSFGSLSSAYVIYFSRSVSVSRTVSFFIILVILLFANEFLKKRISNKYLQFSVYSFVSFTFFTFMVPVFIKEMNDEVFLYSGLCSLGVTLLLILFIYGLSSSARAEIRLMRVLGLVFLIYLMINAFYFFKLIPPVPLALDKGIVAHDIQLDDNVYTVTYEPDEWYVFWRDHRLKYLYTPGVPVFVFSSIFAPTDIKKSILHRWKYFDEKKQSWVLVEDIGYEIMGGRDQGFRGYTVKQNVWAGTWKVEVITKEELVLGVIDFELVKGERLTSNQLLKKAF